MNFTSKVSATCLALTLAGCAADDLDSQTDSQIIEQSYHALAASTPGYAVKFVPYARSAVSQSMQGQIEVTNNNARNVNLTDLTIMYYFTPEGTAPAIGVANYAAVQGTDYRSITPDVLLTSDADKFNIKFSAAAGILKSGETVLVQYQVHKADWSNYNQSNDASFDPNIVVPTLVTTIPVVEANGQPVTIHKKAMLLILDPSVPVAGGGTQRLSQYHGWSDPDTLAEQYRVWFGSTTDGRVTYEIAVRSLRDEFPLKADGFRYTAATYEACMADHSTCHMPDDVDYLKLLQDSTVCDRANAGQIDELWVMGAPYFGFYESRLAGPNGYWYNSPPLGGTTCNKLVPIMGFSYERELAQMIEDFHHRTESTMSRVYGGWQENRMATNWDKFALVAAQSPSFGYSGCGSAHYAPNSTQDYQYDNLAPMQTFCDDFFGYPNLHTPASVLRTITCTEWGCNQVGYQTWWYRHLPSVVGRAPDGKLADWWQYAIDPNAVFLTD